MKLTDKELKDFIEAEMVEVHKGRLKIFDESALKIVTSVLRRKNPYLFKTKTFHTVEDFIRALLDASLSSSEETVFGDFLERLAIFISQREFGGRKSSSEGIDLEFDREGYRYLVTIKSGPNWGNSSQIAKMRSSFATALKTLATSGASVHAQCVEGCCYGQKSKEHGNYRKICGQEFWEFISGDQDLYKRIILPMGAQAREGNEAFDRQYGETVSKITPEFQGLFVKEGGIDWEKLVEFNSARKAVRPRVAAGKRPMPQPSMSPYRTAKPATQLRPHSSQ